MVRGGGHSVQAWAGVPVPNIFPRLFSQFFPNFGREHCFSFLFPITKFGKTVFYSHSQSQNVGTLFFIPIPNPKFSENILEISLVNKVVSMHPF